MKKNKYSDKNFNVSLLPSTRKEQFKDLMKNEWKTILGIGFILFLFAIPYIGLFVFRFVASEFYMSALINGGVEDSVIAFNFVIFRLIFDAANIISYCIIGVGLAGASRVFFNLIYGEGILFKDDYISGIKKNYKTYIIAAIIYSIFKTLFRLVSGLLSLTNTTGYSILYGVLIIVTYVFIVPVIFMMVNLNTLYKIKISNNFKTSSSYVLTSFIPIGLFTILLFFVLYLPLIAQLFIIILIICIITIFVVPIYLLVWKLYLAYLFDRNINETQYPDFYKKGLSK